MSMICLTPVNRAPHARSCLSKVVDRWRMCVSRSAACLCAASVSAMANFSAASKKGEICRLDKQVRASEKMSRQGSGLAIKMDESGCAVGQRLMQALMIVKVKVVG